MIPAIHSANAKPYPPEEWTPAHLALFAGLISGSLGIGEMEKFFSRAYQAHASAWPGINNLMFWRSYLVLVRDRIPADRWNGVLGHCERLFKVLP